MFDYICTETANGIINKLYPGEVSESSIKEFYAKIMTAINNGHKILLTDEIAINIMYNRNVYSILLCENNLEQTLLAICFATDEPDKEELINSAMFDFKFAETKTETPLHINIPNDSPYAFYHINNNDCELELTKLLNCILYALYAPEAVVKEAKTSIGAALKITNLSANTVARILNINIRTFQKRISGERNTPKWESTLLVKEILRISKNLKDNPNFYKLSSYPYEV